MRSSGFSYYSLRFALFNVHVCFQIKMVVVCDPLVFLLLGLSALAVLSVVMCLSFYLLNAAKRQKDRLRERGFFPLRDKVIKDKLDPSWSYSGDNTKMSSSTQEKRDGSSSFNTEASVSCVAVIMCHLDLDIRVPSRTIVLQ